MIPLCLDTDLLVAILRGDPSARHFILGNEKGTQLATTTVNAFEVLFGANRSRKRKENLLATNRLLSRLHILPLDLESADEAASLFASLHDKGCPLDLRDTLIAAIALTKGYVLVTRNTKHFDRAKELGTKIW
ncbi:MAG: type II toxin-antitoxin system VapC family toxin [Candidatus Undinarchaeales archaeon]|jgi:predicted nucleic acid-binding protein|nr:type II toxin-antitoxin system VapC family toxin [Candidatus Undinarchaeales archaeon]MDP7492654.1 type II toxin-antitoxin system VapC family toxin [Candidatus Undinarchaeales archaeon]